MLEKNQLINEVGEREKIESIIAEYLDNHLGELFNKNLKSQLPYLRCQLFNLDDYISQEEHEKCMTEAKAEIEEKILALQEEKEQIQAKQYEFREEYDSLVIKYNETIAERDCIKRELDDTKRILCEVQKEYKAYQDKVDYYENSYAGIDVAYKKYLNLDAKIRHQLAGVFGKGDTLQGFFCGAVQEAHLKSFWEFICHGINNHLWTADVENDLNFLFDFAFDTFNSGSRELTFLRIETHTGAIFDSSSMMRTSDSEQLGRVQKVLLQGYKNRVGTVVTKSLVVIGE